MKKHQLRTEDLKNMPLQQFLTSLVRVVTGRTVQTSFTDFPIARIACTYKSGSGHLVPTERGLIYAPKPCMFFPYDNILQVTLNRASNAVQHVHKYFELQAEFS